MMMTVLEASAGKAISLPCHAKLGNIRDNDERPKLGARSTVQKSLPLAGITRIENEIGNTKTTHMIFLKSFHIMSCTIITHAATAAPDWEIENSLLIFFYSGAR